MKSKTKPKKVKVSSIQSKEAKRMLDLLTVYMSSEWGMTPYNACIKAGFNNSNAEKIADQYNKSYKLPSTTDVLQQEGFTFRRCIRSMVEKAGLAVDKHGNKIEGATKVISANVHLAEAFKKQLNPDMKDADGRTQDFVDVPDEAIRFKYIQELLALGGYTLKKGDGDVTNNNLIIIRPATNERGQQVVEMNIGG